VLRRAVILAVGLAIVSAPRAIAATVALDEVQYCVDTASSCRYMDYAIGVVLSYSGQPGERNRATVRRDRNRDRDAIVVTDRAAALRPGAGCVTAPDGSATCTISATRPLVGYRLDGDDGPDAITVQGALAPATALGQPRVLLGGAGDDVLVGGADADTLVGGAGADRLGGGDGDDRFFAIRGGTHLTIDGSDPDIADGGPGLDTADYSLRAATLRIDLGRPTAGGGQPGEADRLTSIEHVLGGSGPDVLIGGDGPERLDGRQGPDHLFGRGGDDVLIGGAGSDVLSGGAGDDELGTGIDGPRSHRPAGDRARCGAGRDRIGEYENDDFFGESWTGPDANDRLALDCEDVRFGIVGDSLIARVDPRPRRGRRTWTFRNPCVTARAVVTCTGEIRLAPQPGTHEVARAALGRRGTVEVRLGRSAGRALARASRVAVSLRVSSRSRPREEAGFVLALR
jgi:hypothetical protein